MLHGGLDLSLNFFFYIQYDELSYSAGRFPTGSTKKIVNSSLSRLGSLGDRPPFTDPTDNSSFASPQHPQLSPLEELDLPSAAQTVYVRQTAVPVSQEALSFLPAASPEQEGAGGGGIDRCDLLLGQCYLVVPLERGAHVVVVE